MKTILSIQVFILIAILLSWGVNFNKFVKSDFEPSYKREIIHGVGLIPAVSLVTVWFNIEETK